MASTPDTLRGHAVRIHYERPGSGITLFEQEWVTRDGECTVTLLRSAQLPRPVMVEGTPVLEPGAAAVWFTFDGLMHDIGRFHDALGHFTGLYANVITPVEELTPLEWRTTDLFLDVWLGSDGKPRLLDEDELDEAVDAGFVSVQRAASARQEARRMMDAARAGDWPPPVVNDWPLERCVDVLEGGTTRGKAV